MFGDSKLDHIVSNFYQIDFIFVKGWTDLKDYQKYCADNNIEIISSVSEYFIR